jgi:biopolymer transport protein ExbB/biopolymer transport protein TolQ
MQFGLYEIWQTMGLAGKAVVIVLGFMSVFALSVGIDRLWAFLRPRKRARRYAEAVQPLLQKGDFLAASKVELADASPMGRVVSAGIGEYLDARGTAPSGNELVTSVQETLERAVSAEMGRLRRGLGALATVGSTAPFVGLFGTVVGIVNSFEQIAKTGAGGLGAVSAGIAEALVATALGILVAVPAVMLFNYFTGQLEAIEDALTDAGGVVVDYVRKQGWADEQTVPESKERAA